MIDYARRMDVRFRGGLIRYAFGGIKPGDFLCAILRNDLADAMRRADADAIASEQVKAILMFVWNELPGNCHGSPERVEEWLSRDEWDPPTSDFRQLPGDEIYLAADAIDAIGIAAREADRPAIPANRESDFRAPMGPLF